MDYILKEHFLPFGEPKQLNIQYLQWVEKKRADKQKAEYEQFRTLWNQIDEEQKKREKSRIKNSKSGKCETSAKQVVTLKPETTYIRNMVWRQTVDQKLDKIRREQQEELDKEELMQIQPVPKEKKLFKEPEHKGPIKAWQDRFQEYIQNKQGNIEDSQTTFHPQINSVSRRITRNMVGKVENRLIQYGEKLKEKKVEMQYQFQLQLFDDKKRQNNASIESHLSDIFFRLYKDGEKINRKRNEQRSEYSFTPEINQTSIDLVSKISHKRRPLYESKLTKEETNHIPSKYKPQQSKQRRQSSFSDFLKRNEALLNKQELNKYKKKEIEKQKQNLQIEKCTFAPQINRRSKKLVANRPSEPTQTQTVHTYPVESSNDIPVVLNNNASVSYQCKASDEKLSRQEQKMFRLNSEGSILPQQRHLNLSQLEYISKDLHNGPEEDRSDSIEKVSIWRKNLNISRDLQSDLFATDRMNERSAIITEEIEQDSIQKEKNQLWEHELEMMESQIEAMMKRTIN